MIIIIIISQALHIRKTIIHSMFMQRMSSLHVKQTR